MSGSYDLGEKIAVDGEFKRESDGELIDPTTVKFDVKKPDGVTTAYVYGTDAELVKDAVGQYHAELDLDQSGNWHYRMYSEGTGQTAAEDDLFVRQSLV